MFAAAAANMMIAWPAIADGKRMCLDAHGEAQTLRRAGKLRAASAKLGVCARTTCPPLVMNDCAQWLTEVEAAQPSIVVRVRNARDEDTLEARVIADGELLAQRLEGTALVLDPGEHVLRVELADGTSETRHVVVIEGQKNQLVEVVFPAEKRALPLAVPTSTTPTERSRGPGAGFFIASGVGLVSLGVFATFAVSGLGRESELRSACAPACAQRELDDLSRRYVVADVALGTAAVSAAVALGLFLFTGGRHAPGSF